MYQERIYRNKVASKGLVTFRVIDYESDLMISAKKDLSKEASKSLSTIRREIIAYINKRPEFYKSFKPIKSDNNAPSIVKDMIKYSAFFNVGPMATVAGAISYYLGSYLAKFSDEVIVENGGDIYIKVQGNRIFNIYTEDKIFQDKLILKITDKKAIGLCTSSGKLGHSTSFGKSEAVVIKGVNSIVADAAATAYANRVKSKKDIKKLLLEAKLNQYIEGIIIIVDGEMGVWGDIEFYKGENNVY